MTLVEKKKKKIVWWTEHVRIWKEEMTKAHKLTVEREEGFQAQTHINGKTLGTYTEINISQNIVNQPSDTHQKHNGQNKLMVPCM